MSSESPLSRAQQDQVTARAETDAEFRTRLLDEPRGAIGEELGIELSDDLAIEVVEEKPKQLRLVVSPAASELSDDDLEQAAGGSGLFGPPEKLDQV